MFAGPVQRTMPEGIDTDIQVPIFQIDQSYLEKKRLVPSMLLDVGAGHSLESNLHCTLAPKQPPQSSGIDKGR